MGIPKNPQLEMQNLVKKKDATTPEGDKTTPDADTPAGGEVIDAPPAGCAATLWGCAKCDADDQNKCTECVTKSNWEIDEAKKACTCVKAAVGNSEKNCAYLCANCKDT